MNARAHHSGHTHLPARSADRRWLAVALSLIVAFMVSEVSVGFAVHSLALLADAGHMMTDAAALALAIAASVLAQRPPTTQWTFGFQRAEILSAAINGVALVIVSGLVVAGAVSHLMHPAVVSGTALTILGAVGVLINIVAVLVVSRANRENLNVRAASRHLLSDLGAFAGTLIAGVVILTTGFRRADALASLLVVTFMIATAWGLLRDSGRILLEVAPKGVDLNEVRQHLLEIDHVVEIHDLHVWVVTSDLPTLSAHVVVDDSCFHDGLAPQILDQLQHCLAGHFDVEHSTFQLEAHAHREHEKSGHRELPR
jgi:cobalt-zinc-cadmium efflux system protein